MTKDPVLKNQLKDSGLCWSIFLYIFRKSMMHFTQFLSCVWLFAVPLTVAHQASLSLGFSMQEYRSGLPFPPPGDLPNPRIELMSPILEDRIFAAMPPGKANSIFEGSVQAGFRKGRGTRDQIANICCIIEKAREFQKNIYFCFIDYHKAFDCVDHNKLWKILKEMGIPDHLICFLKKSVCRLGSNS